MNQSVTGEFVVEKAFWLLMKFSRRNLKRATGRTSQKAFDEKNFFIKKVPTLLWSMFAVLSVSLKPDECSLSITELQSKAAIRRDQWKFSEREANFALSRWLLSARFQLFTAGIRLLARQSNKLLERKCIFALWESSSEIFFSRIRLDSLCDKSSTFCASLLEVQSFESFYAEQLGKLVMKRKISLCNPNDKSFLSNFIDWLNHSALLIKIHLRSN